MNIPLRDQGHEHAEYIRKQGKKKNTLLKQYSKITGREEEIYFKESMLKKVKPV